MSDVAALIERSTETLRRAEFTGENPTGQRAVEAVAHKLLDALTSFSARIAELERERDDDHRLINKYWRDYEIWRDRADAAEAKLAKAEEALTTAQVELLEAADKFNVIHHNHPGAAADRGIGRYQEEDKEFCAKWSGRASDAAARARDVLAEIKGGE